MMAAALVKPEMNDHVPHARAATASSTAIPVIRRAQLDVAVDRSPVTRGIERNERHTSADAQGWLMSSAVALLE